MRCMCVYVYICVRACVYAFSVTGFKHGESNNMHMLVSNFFFFFFRFCCRESDLARLVVSLTEKEKLLKENLEEIAVLRRPKLTCAWLCNQPDDFVRSYVGLPIVGLKALLEVCKDCNLPEALEKFK